MAETIGDGTTGTESGTAGMVEHKAKARPWPRYFARSFDYCLIAMVCFVVLLLSGMDAKAMQEYSFLLVWGIALCWVVVEASLLTVFGTTPGKGLLNISVAQSDGEEMTYSRAFVRSLRVWFFGMGTGLPLFSLIGNLYAYTCLNRYGVTSWDEKGGFTVTQGPVGALRIVCFILAVPSIWVVAVGVVIVAKLLGMA